MKRFKNLSLVLALAMVLQILMPVNLAYAAGDDVVNRIYQTDIDIKINGEGPVGGKFENVQADSEIKMKYKFHFLNEADGEDYNYLPGDYFYVSFPEEIIIKNPIGEMDVKYGGVKIGTLEMATNSAKITFTEGIDDFPSDVKVEFEVSGQFTEDIQNNGGDIKIKLKYDGKVINVGVIPKPTEPVNLTLEKPNPTINIKTGEISWTIKVKPEEEKTAYNVVLKDRFTTKNHKYVDGSFKVNGYVVTGSAIVDSTTSGSAISYTEYGFDYEFPEPISSEQVITYKTRIEDMSFSSEGEGNKTNIIYNNEVNAYLGSTHKGKKENKVTLDWINKTPKLVDDGRKIEWTVTINNIDGYLNGKNNVKIIDKIDENQIFVSQNDSKYPMKLILTKPGGVVTTTGSTIGSILIDGDTLIYSFEQGVEFTKAVLTYYTEINNPNANSNSNVQYTNDAKLIWGDNEDGPSHGGNIGIGMGIIDKKSDGPGSIYGNSGDIIINWTVYINKNRVEITDAVFKDLIPSGLIYDEDSFRLDGSIVTAPGAIYDSETRQLTYNMGNINKTSHIITYSTKVDKDFIELFTNEDVEFINKANLSGTGLSEEQEVIKTHKFKSEVIDKAVIKSYNYITREVEWKIVINKNEIPLNKITVKDIIPLGMSFMPESFMVNSVKPAQDDENFVHKVHEIEDIENKDWFTYYIESTESKTFEITYKTKVKEAWLEVEDNLNKTLNFENDATVYLEDGKKEDVSKTTSMDNIIVGKVGEQIAADFVKWSVPINVSKLKIDGEIIITDILQEGLSLDVNSVKLYEVVVATDGTIIDVEPAIDFVSDSENYERNYDQDSRTFTFTFKNGIEKAYRLEFVTDVNVNYIKINNSISLNGAGKSSSSDEFTLEVDVDDYDASGSGVSGKLKIIKLDEKGEQLSGAKIRVYDKTGRYDFDNEYKPEYSKDKLAYRWYSIEEVEAPDGYLLDTTIRQVKIDSETEVEVKIINQKALADVNFFKLNEEGLALAGAEFKLTKDGDSDWEPRIVVSDEYGLVNFEDIELGEYIIEEIASPTGYEMLSETISVTVGYNENKTGTVVTFNVNEGMFLENGTLYVSNDLVDVFAKVVINKEYEFDKALTGAEFALFEINSVEPLATATEKDGKVIFENIEPGKYVIREISAPDGYLISDTEVLVKVYRNSEKLDEALVSYRFEGEEASSEELTIVNEAIKIEFIKKNQAGYPLDGAEFTLYDSDGVNPVEGFEPVVSNDFGEVIFTAVPEGSYIIKETKAPSGYRNLNKDILVTVVVNDNNVVEINFSYSDESEVLYGENSEFIVENERRPGGGGSDPVLGKIAIKKTDGNKKVLSGAEFTLYDEDGKVVARGVSGSDGTLSFDNLKYGTYVIKETKAPEGYIITVDEKEVVINSTAVRTFTFTNKKEEPEQPEIPDPETPVVPSNGKITINKVDENNMALAGAEFTLYNENNEVLRTAVSDESGRVIFENLKDGKYFVRETKAPEGYEIVSDALTVNIAEGKSNNYRFRNVPTDTEIEDPNIPSGWEEINDPDVPVDTTAPTLPNTGYIFNTWMLAAIGFIFIFTGMVLFKRRVRN